MATILLRIFFVYKLLNAVLLYLVPKKLRTYLPTSWYPYSQQQRQQQQQEDSKKSEPASPLSPSIVVPSLPRVCIPRRMDADELKRVFQIFDTNGDGMITKQELNESLEKMGIFIPDTELTCLIEKIDVNGDGCVDVDEFGALYENIMDGRNEEEDMKEAFKVFDLNGDGFITVDELKIVLGSLGLKQARAVDDCKRMIMRVDADGDGMVNFSEFKQMMRGGGFAALSN